MSKLNKTKNTINNNSDNTTDNNTLTGDYTEQKTIEQNTNTDSNINKMQQQIDALTTMMTQFMINNNNNTKIKTETETVFPSPSLNSMSDDKNNDTSMKNEISSHDQKMSSSSSSHSSSFPSVPQTITSAITNSTTTSSFNARTPICLSDVKVLVHNVNSVTFGKYKDEFLLAVLKKGLDQYLENDYNTVCESIYSINSTVSMISIQAHVRAQSASLFASLIESLGVHASRHLDRMKVAANLPENKNTFIKNNVFWLWTDILSLYQTVDPFTKNRLLESLFTFRHSHNPNQTPAVILEKIMNIKRQLATQNYTVDDDILATVLFSSIPDSMENVRQLLVSTKSNTIEQIYSAMENYYISKAKTNYNNNNNKNEEGTAKAYTFNDKKTKK